MSTDPELSLLVVLHAEAMQIYYIQSLEVGITASSTREDMETLWDSTWSEINDYLRNCGDLNDQSKEFIRSNLLDWAHKNTPYDYKNKLLNKKLEEEKGRRKLSRAADLMSFLRSCLQR